VIVFVLDNVLPSTQTFY